MELIDTKRFTAVETAIYCPPPRLLRHEKKAKRFTATEHTIYSPTNIDIDLDIALFK